MTRDNLFMRMKDEEWDTGARRNLTAAFRLSARRRQGHDAPPLGPDRQYRSVVGVTGNPGQGNYAAAKAGLIGMTKALAAEVASRNITVNCVAPGFIASPMTDALNEKQQRGDPGPFRWAASGRATRLPPRSSILPSRRGRLRDRADLAREWRNGDVLKRLKGPARIAVMARRPLARAGKLVLSNVQLVQRG